MKISVPAALFLFLLAVPAFADDNPYMPGGNGGGSFLDSLSSDQRDQVMQALMPPSGEGEDYVPPQGPVSPGNAYQDTQNQQAIDGAVEREQADREREIQALKDAFSAQIQDLQRKIDHQQDEIDDLRYKDRF